MASPNTPGSPADPYPFPSSHPRPHGGGKADRYRTATTTAGTIHTDIDTDKSRQTATLYDAVAGRVSSSGFIPRRLVFSSTRDTPSSSSAPVPPEAVLFRRKNAPARFAEDDVYFAKERRPGIDLPDSDLLKALHCYASDFYSRNTTDAGTGDWKSLDETALIALGVLIEEVSCLSKTGDMVFTDGEQVAISASSPNNSQGQSRGRISKKRRVDESDIDTN